MAKRKVVASAPVGRAIAYPMARIGDLDPESDEAVQAFYQKLPAWGANPVIKEVSPVGSGWYVAKVEVDFPPREKETE